MLMAVISLLLGVAVVAVLMPAALALRGEVNQQEVVAALVLAAVALLAALALAGVEVGREVREGKVAPGIPTMATTGKEIPATGRATEGRPDAQ